MSTPATFEVSQTVRWGLCSMGDAYQRCGRTTGLCEVKNHLLVVLFAVNSQQIGRRDDVSFQGTHPNMPSSLQFNAKLTGLDHHEAETPPPTVYLLLCVRQLLFPTKWRLQ
jgi:hypothetical protein